MEPDYLPLLPQIILVSAGMMLMLLEAFAPTQGRKLMGRITVVATAAAAYFLSLQWKTPPRAILQGMFIVDYFGIFFQWLFLTITAVCALISIRFNEREAMDRGEYFALLLFSCSGMSLMAVSGDLILTFLGIEILSIATYVLAGFKRGDARSNESSLKYFLLGSFATAFLLYGIALIYGSTGSTNYRVIQELAAFRNPEPATARMGLVLLMVGFGFKIALVPFHTWAPDVYEGAPTPVTAFMTVGPKAAGIAALLRILTQAFPFLSQDWTSVLWLLAILTMTLGNIAAVLQTNIKRMLAYSAIAHAGYILVGFVVNSSSGFGAVLFYLVIYSVMNLGAFSIILSFSRKGDLRVNLEDYAGLGRKAPLAAAALSLFLVSLAGIPLTGGFMGKFYLFSAAIQEGFVGLAIIGVLNSALSVFYYFRLMVMMYMKDAPADQPEAEPMALPVAAILALSALAILWLGIAPAYMFNLASYSSFALK